MRYMQLTLAILLLAVTFLLGCGQRPPKGMPPVYPCKITLTKDGNPFANVSVGLINNSMSGSLAVGGATNANGVAEINSSYGSTYSTKGAPAGEFQVILTEVPAIPEDQRVTGEELSKMSGPEADAAIARMNAARAAIPRVLPLSFATPSTPLKITVTESKQGTEVSFEVNDYK